MLMAGCLMALPSRALLVFGSPDNPLVFNLYIVFVRGGGFVIAFGALLLASAARTAWARWPLCFLAFLALFGQHRAWGFVDDLGVGLSGHRDRTPLVVWVVVAYCVAALWTFFFLPRKRTSARETPSTNSHEKYDY